MTNTDNTPKPNLEHILLRVRGEQANLQAALDAFYAESYRTPETYGVLNQKIMDILDTILSPEDWQQSFFLRNTLKPLVDLRYRAGQLQEKLLEEKKIKEGRLTLPPTQQLIYISLYQSRGSDMNHWELLLRSLPKQVQGRPIYADPAGIEKMLRSKTNLSVEAYVVVAVEKTAVSQETSTDRLGQPVLKVAEGAIDPKNIVEFVYLNQHYRWQQNQLRLQTK